MALPTPEQVALMNAGGYGAPAMGYLDPTNPMAIQAPPPLPPGVSNLPPVNIAGAPRNTSTFGAPGIDPASGPLPDTGTTSAFGKPALEAVTAGGYVPGSQAEQAAKLRGETTGGDLGKTVAGAQGAERKAIQQGAGAEGGKAAQAAVDTGGFRQPIGASKPNAELLAASKQLQSSMNTADTNTILGGTNLQGAMRAVGDAQSAQATGTADALQQQAKEVGDIHQQELEHQARSTASMQGVEAEIKARMAAIKDVDPDRYWNSKSTGNKITTAIGVALGQLGAAMPHTGGGGKNPAMELLQSGIENDVKAQQKNIDNEWKKVSTVHELGGDAMKEAAFKSDRLDKAKIEAGEKAKLVIGQYAAQTQSAQAQAELAKLSIGVQQQWVDGPKVEMDKRRVGFLQAQAMQAAQAAGAGQPSPEAQKAYHAYAAKMDEENAKNRADNKPETPVLNGGQWYQRSWLGNRPTVDPNAPAPKTGTGPLSGFSAADRPAAQKELDAVVEKENATRALDGAIGGGLKGTSFFEHPIDATIGSIFSSGEGSKRNGAIDRYNATLIAQAHKQYGFKTNDDALAILKPYLLNHGDKDDHIARVTAAGKQFAAPDIATPTIDAAQGFKGRLLDRAR